MYASEGPVTCGSVLGEFVSALREKVFNGLPSIVDPNPFQYFAAYKDRRGQDTHGSKLALESNGENQEVVAAERQAAQLFVMASLQVKHL